MILIWFGFLVQNKNPSFPIDIYIFASSPTCKNVKSKQTGIDFILGKYTQKKNTTKKDSFIALFWMRQKIDFQFNTSSQWLSAFFTQFEDFWFFEMLLSITKPSSCTIETKVNTLRINFFEEYLILCVVMITVHWYRCYCDFTLPSGEFEFWLPQ